MKGYYIKFSGFLCIFFLLICVQGGVSARVINSVLALKSYHEWKQSGSIGVWKFGGNVKPTTTVKQFVRKNSDPFTNSLSRTSSMNEKSSNALSHDADLNKMVSNIKVYILMIFHLSFHLVFSITENNNSFVYSPSPILDL